ncbi:hypothetical protein PRIPAC_85995 [Pristionchus pacificus]|nr:hypothetical protein PRIPAC_85995 [Pristionchus pacificus]
MEYKKKAQESLALAAFPLQWLTAGYFYTSNILGCCRSVDHLVYYRKVIKEGKKDYKSPFSYYEMGMAVVQPALVAVNPAYIGTATFWVMIVPWIASLYTCTAMYLKGGKAEEEEEEDDFAVLEVIDDEEIEESKKMEIEFPDFVVVDKSDLM